MIEVTDAVSTTEGMRTMWEASSQGQALHLPPSWEGSTHPGATRRWSKFKAAKLRAHPLCQWREADGTKCRRPATEGGPHHPAGRRRRAVLLG